MIENIRISDLPGYGKVFVGIFAALMVFVLLWAVFIYTVADGLVEGDRVPAYMGGQPGYSSEDEAGGGAISPVDSARYEELEEEAMEKEAGEVAHDSEAVLAPIWDSGIAGREVHADSVSAAERFEKVDSVIEAEIAEEGVGPGTGYDYNPDRGFDLDEFKARDFRRNVGLAHTHINGQTLLYFALGLVFLFTSASPRIKKIVFWLFGIAVVTHATGLTGNGYHWFFDDILAVSGVTIIVVGAYMVFWVFVDLGKKRRERGR